MARSLEKYEMACHMRCQEDRAESAITEPLSPQGHLDAADAGSTQPTQPNPREDDKASGSQDSALSPTQPNCPAPDSVWGILEPSNQDPPIYLRFPKKQYTFGRSSKCNISFPDKQLSSKHCTFVLLNEGAARSIDFKVGVIDHQSQVAGPRVLLTIFRLNGTFINDFKTIPERLTILKDGDVVFLTKMNIPYDLQFKELSFRFRSLYQRYELSTMIGRGHFSKVHLGICRITRKKFAIKLLKKSILNEAVNQLYLERETKIMLRVSHPFILSIQEVVESSTQYGLVMELAPGGDLFDYYDAHGPISECTFHRIFYQILSAVNYLHSNEIVHRDIKPENVLVLSKQTLHIKLSDFGLARFFDNKTSFSSLVGSPTYAAPEVNNHATSRSYTCACDMWSIGVMMFFSIFRKMPFDKQQLPITIQDTAQISADWSRYSNSLRELITRLLVFNPEGRYTAQKALTCRYFTKYQQDYEDLVKMELHFKPAEGALKIP
ncbi:serine/threonine protein kinase, partial [Massospora cicadina]